MAESLSNPSSSSDTTTSDKVVAQIKRTVIKAWESCVKAEERSSMLIMFMKAGVGTRDVEQFVRSQCGKVKSKKGGGERDGKQV